jgi:hypothetical protein
MTGGEAAEVARWRSGPARLLDLFPGNAYL